MPSAAVPPRVGFCPEYQRLLNTCQQALSAWQQRRTRAERASMVGPRVRAELKHLQDQYTKVYTQLESHEQFCQTCQYVSKVGGLDFESMASALHRHNFFRPFLSPVSFGCSFR